MSIGSVLVDAIFLISTILFTSLGGANIIYFLMCVRDNDIGWKEWASIITTITAIITITILSVWLLD